MSKLNVPQENIYIKRFTVLSHSKKRTEVYPGIPVLMYTVFLATKIVILFYGKLFETCQYYISKDLTKNEGHLSNGNFKHFFGVFYPLNLIETSS